MIIRFPIFLQMVIQTGLKLHLYPKRKMYILGIGKVIYINKREMLYFSIKNLGWSNIYYTILFEYFVMNVARQLDNSHYDSGIYQSDPENSYGLYNDQVIAFLLVTFSKWLISSFFGTARIWLLRRVFFYFQKGDILPPITTSEYTEYIGSDYRPSIKSLNSPKFYESIPTPTVSKTRKRHIQTSTYSKTSDDYLNSPVC